jgi:hypothetical protein
MDYDGVPIQVIPAKPPRKRELMANKGGRLHFKAAWDKRLEGADPKIIKSINFKDAAR